SREEKLINAVKNCDLKNVETLIASGAGLEARDNGDRTALMRAAEKGYSDIVIILIKSGADVNARDKFDWTPLFMAADKGHVEIVKILIATGATVETDTLEGLFIRAAHEDNTEMVKALLMVESPRIRKRTLDHAYMSALSND